MRKRFSMLQNVFAGPRAPRRRARSRAGLRRAATGLLILLAAPAAAQQVAFPSRAIPDGGVGGLRVKGSNTIGAELMPAFVAAFARRQGLDYRIDEGGDTPAMLTATGYRDGAPALTASLERLGSSTGFKGLIAGEADIGMSSRVIKDKEVKTLAELGFDMRDENSEHVVALDGLAVIVSPENPLQTITPEEIAKIFSGQITDWSALGQPPAPIALHARDDNSGTFDTFNSLALKPFDAKISPQAHRYFSNLEIAKRVASDPHAIGFTPLALADSAKPLALALDCGLVIAPDPFSVKAEEYPLGRRLHLYTKGRPDNAAAAALIDFAKSDAAQPLVEEAGFVNQTLIAQGPNAFANHIMSGMAMSHNAAESQALQRMFNFAFGSERLSITFRFVEDEVLLDSKSLADAGRLIQWLSLPENATRELRLMGFGDDEALSLERAEAARRALLINAPIGFNAKRISVHGFGDAAPVACPEAKGGARINRRVEAWASQ